MNLEHRAWMLDAKCRHMDTAVFFPTRHETAVAAKKICETCPVKDDCLEYALEWTDLVGIWGGTSGRERRQLRSLELKLARGQAKLCTRCNTIVPIRDLKKDRRRPDGYESRCKACHNEAQREAYRKTSYDN